MNMVRGEPTWGFSTPDYLLVDLDNADRVKALGVADMIYSEYPEVGNCLMRRSSAPQKYRKVMWDRETGLLTFVTMKEGWHLIFGGRIGIGKVIKISNLLEELGIVDEDSTAIRRRRGDNTLRITNYKPYECDGRGLAEDCILVKYVDEDWADEGIFKYLRVASLFTPVRVDETVFRRVRLKYVQARLILNG